LSCTTAGGRDFKIHLACKTVGLLRIITSHVVSRTRDLDPAERLGVPRPTARSWLRRGVREVVSADVLDDDAGQLRVRVLRLQRRAKAPCHLDDRTSCPKTRPTQLASNEVHAMRDMVTYLDFRHFSIRSMALHAQRIGRVFAVPGTRSRHIRANGWLRPRRRIHPPKPKEGIRTTRPNGLWDLDVTIIKLLDGTRLFLHGVMDSHLRKLLAWELATTLDPTTTCRVLEAAGQHRTGDAPTVACDSGVENVNGKVDTLIDRGRLRRVLALVEVSYSNSMVEAWWRNLKNSWLYLHTLDSPAAVEKLIAFYVEQHNTVMPCRAFNGRTPDEVYFGTATDLEDELAVRRREARAERVATNRALTCATCEPRGAPAEALSRDAA